MLKILKVFHSVHSDKEEIYEYTGTQSSHILRSLCGITNPDPDYAVHIDHAVRYSIEYVCSGKGVIMTDNHHYTVSKGDFFILPPGYQHYYSDRSDPWKKIWVTIDKKTNFPLALMQLFGINDIVYFQGVNSPVHLDEIFELFKNSSDDITEKFEDLLYKLIADLARLSEKSQKNPSPISVAKNYIDAHISEKIAVSEIADYIGMSLPYFSTLFKKTYGLPPNQYILKEKIELAKKLLLLSVDTNIPNVAIQLSFTDVPHFSKTFSQYVGMPPSEFRKQNKQNIG